MSTAATKVDVTAADVLACFRLPPEDRPGMAASDPMSREELLTRAGAKASERRSGLSPAPPWRHANKARASQVIDKLVEDGRLIAGPPDMFAVHARASTLYATPEVLRWHRQAHYERLAGGNLARARAEAVTELTRLHTDEFNALVAQHYEAPDYRVDLEEAVPA